MKFLYIVQQHKNNNKMDAKNLATIFGPILIRSKEEKTSQEYLGDTSIVVNLVETMILNYNQIFEEQS